MKQRKNYMNQHNSYLVLAILAILINLSACHQSPFTKAYLSIDQVVDDINKEFIDLEGIGYISSTRIYKYYSQEKIVDFHVKNTNIPEELLKQGINNNCFNEKHDLSIDLFKLLLQGLNENQKILFDSIASFKYTARFNIHSPNDTAIAIISLSPIEIKEALSTPPITDKDDYALFVLCKGINIILPYVDKDEIWESLEVDQNNLIHHIKIDDKQLPIEKVDKQQLRAIIINRWKESNSYPHYFHYAFMTGRGIRYVYKGTISDKTIIIQLSNSEVYDIMHHKI